MSDSSDFPFDTASRLMVIWEKVLGHKAGIHDNFFEIGGNSFLALRLGEEIERSFGKPLPVGVIFYLPTIERLALFLIGEEQLPSGFFSIVPLQVAGGRQPIFIVHWMVRDLVRHLGSERPVYALSFGLAAKLDQQLEFPASVEDLAAHYIDEMRLAQPAGPYTLIGYSAGGLVAYEMAQQLRAQNDKVDVLAMIDTYRAQDFFFKGGRLPLHRQLVNMLSLPPIELYYSFRYWYWGPLAQKLHLRQHDEQSAAYSNFMMSTSDFWMSYVPQPYPGKLVFFKSSGVLSVRNRRIAPEQFWSDLAPVELHEVPGRHLSLAYHSPYARVLATKLQACLAVPDEGADHKEQMPYFRPDPATIARSQLSMFMHYCGIARGRAFDDYREFDEFAVSEYRWFWELFLTWSGVRCNGDFEPMCQGSECESAVFFPNLHLNYAENLLNGDPDDPVLTIRHYNGDSARLTRGDLAQAVARCAAGMTWMGVRRGDRVVAVARNNAEVIIAALASATIGAVFSSCPQDMSAFAILTRFQPLAPKLLFANTASRPWDIGMTLSARVAEVVEGLASLIAVVALDDGDLSLHPVTAPVYRLGDLGAEYRGQFFARHPFNHPLFILFSSGTTGPPKCIVHGTGGTLLEHLKEHRLHCDLKPGDKLFFQTSAGWMMWNWQLSALACGAEIVVYDGPLGGPETLWRIVAEERVTVFGTSAAFLQFCEQAGYTPRQLDLGALRAILSTGSILYPPQYDWVKSQVKELPLQSISGGTDIIGCFVLGNPNLPVYRGEAQCRSLGLDVRARDGELVCANPFPSRPIGFYGDDGSRFHNAYFSQHPGVWTHGDLVEFTAHGGAILHGRSDGVLNIRGIRIGPAEIYRILQDVPEIAEAMAVEQEIAAELGGAQLVLLVVMRPGIVFDPLLDARLRYELFTKGSAAHVPARIIEVEALPVTHSGKRSEAAARDAINQRPVKNREALANPEALDALRF